MNVDTLFQEMSGEAVAQRVHGDCLVEAGGHHGLGDTQTGGIDRDEGGSHFEIWHRLQETHDLVPRQHGWQCVRPAGIGNLLGYLLLSEGRAVEES